MPLDQTETTEIHTISIGKRLRQLNRDTVEALKQSIFSIGLRTPISVRYISDEVGFELIAGLHRLTACRELGWEEVPIREEEGTETDAKMWVEVDRKSLMRAIPGGVLKGRIRRVMDRELAAMKAAVESATPGGSDS